MKENERDPMDELLRERISEKHPIFVGLPICTEYKKNHENCGGCDSELGCLKLVTAKTLILLDMMLPTPTDLETTIQRMQDVMKRLDAVIEARTIAEVKTML